MDNPRWNIYFTMEGPGGTVEVPNNTNPVPCANMASLLATLSSNLPGGQFGLEVVGVRIEKARESDA